MKDLRLRSLAIAIVCAGSLAAWQALTVHYSYGGNWTALYCTGSLFHPPPAPLQSEHIYIFQNSSGYDGQLFHYIAHDPFFQRGFGSHVDRFRYRRILIPGLAFLLAFGQDRWVDAAYIGIIWIFIFLGAYWLARLALRCGYPAWLGLLFALAPAVLVSIDRLTVDVALATCSVGFVLYEQEKSSWKLYVVLLIAGLTRETGLLLPAAYCIYLTGQRRFRQSAIYATSVIPAACWYLFVSLHAAPDNTGFLSPFLFSGLVTRIIHPFPYPFGGFMKILASGLDLLALAGIAGALLWAIWRMLRGAWTPVTIAMYLFVVLALTLTRADAWAEVYAFGRTLTPLVLLAALDGMSIGSALPTAALLAIDPRIGLQMGVQILNVVRGIVQ